MDTTQKTTLKTRTQFSRFLAFSFLLFGLLGNTLLQAQPKGGAKGPGDKREKIEALRKLYFNEKLSLSETEQKAFWPLYNEFKQKEQALRDSFKNRYKPNDIVFMDDRQAEEFLNAGLKLQDDQNNLYRTYVEKFKKVLPIKKVAMLPMVEKSFRKDMLKKAGMHKKGGPKGGPHGGPHDPGPEPAEEE